MRTERAFKYHGIGNDFVILDRRESGEDIDAGQAVALCDRRRGLGADGVLVLLPSKVAAAKMVVHNADGSCAEMCGNGLRCAVKYLVDHSNERPRSIPVETGAGVLDCALHFDDQGVSEVEVAMGPARLVAGNLPSGKSGAPFIDAPVPGRPELRGTAISMGNPHLILSNARPEDVLTTGPLLERHPDFPDRTNVEFVRQEGNRLTVAVWERGSGYTQACGTGATATVAAYVQRGLLPANEWIPVQLPGGELQIKVAPDLSACTLKGPATYVYEAQIPAPFVG